MTDNEIGIVGAMTIGEVLMKNNTLTELDLNGETNRCEAKHVVIVIEEKTGNCIGGTGAMSISNALKINAVLHRLQLGCS